MAELSRELATQGSSVIPATAPDPAPWRRFVPKMWYAHLTLWIACAFVGFPLIYAVLISTQSNAEVANFTLSPGTQFNENWHQVMVNRFLGDFMLRSVILSVVITVGKTILALLSGLAFVYFRFPGKWIVFAFVLATLMMQLMSSDAIDFSVVIEPSTYASAALIVPRLCLHGLSIFPAPRAVRDANAGR